MDNLPSVLSAYYTTSRIPTCKTPYLLVYMTKGFILVEIGMLSFPMKNFNKENNDVELRLNLDLLGEKRERAQVR